MTVPPFHRWAHLLTTTAPVLTRVSCDFCPHVVSGVTAAELEAAWRAHMAHAHPLPTAIDLWLAQARAAGLGTAGDYERARHAD